MYYVFYSGGTATNSFVETIVRSELLSTKEKNGGFEVQDIPEPNAPEGFEPILRANPTDKSLFYEFVKSEPSPNERLAVLETRNVLLSQENEKLKTTLKQVQGAIDELILAGSGF